MKTNEKDYTKLIKLGRNAFGIADSFGKATKVFSIAALGCAVLGMSAAIVSDIAWDKVEKGRNKTNNR